MKFEMKIHAISLDFAGNAVHTDITHEVDYVANIYEALERTEDWLDAERTHGEIYSAREVGE